MANPFEDPDVQQAVNNGNGGDATAAQSSNVYGGGAYDNNASSGPTMSKAQQDIAISVGTAVAKDAASQAITNVQDDYQTKSAVQANHHSAPEKPDWCSKLFMWLPVRYLAWFAGLLLVIFPVLDWIFFVNTFIYGVVGFYLFVFGIMMLFVESPSFSLTRKPQLYLFYWFRILSRMWGRASFYIFVSILCYVEIDNTFTLTFPTGIYLMIVALLMLVFSFQSATKYRRVFDYIAQGTDPLNTEEMAGRLTRKFDEIDMDGDGYIGSLEIVKLVEESGRTLSNAERHAIQTFLDVNCNGAISRDDFVNQYMNHNTKQKWL